MKLAHETRSLEGEGQVFMRATDALDNYIFSIMILKIT